MEQLVVGCDFGEANVNIGKRGFRVCEVVSQGFDIGSLPGAEAVFEFGVGFSFAAAVMRKREEVHEGAAGDLRAGGFHEEVEHVGEGLAREQLFAVAVSEQGAGLFAQGVDDMPVIDHMIGAAFVRRPLAWKCFQEAGAEEQIKAVVVDVNAEGVADQA